MPIPTMGNFPAKPAGPRATAAGVAKPGLRGGAPKRNPEHQTVLARPRRRGGEPGARAAAVDGPRGSWVGWEER